MTRINRRPSREVKQELEIQVLKTVEPQIGLPMVLVARSIAGYGNTIHAGSLRSGNAGGGVLYCQAT